MIPKVLLLLWMVPIASAQEPWSWATYFGGQGDDDMRLLASDSAGNTFVAGLTYSYGPPFSGEPPGFSSSNPRIFIAKFDPEGTIVYAQILGFGAPSALATDASGNLLVAGSLSAGSAFTTPGAFQREGSLVHAFLAKFSPAGEKLFATYFGATNITQISTLVIDALGRPVFCGPTRDDNVPLTASNLFTPRGGRSNAYCARLSSDGARLEFSTLLADTAGRIVPQVSAIGPGGALILAGSTPSADLPLINAFQSNDRRRSLYRAQQEHPFESSGGPELGTIRSIQVLGSQVFSVPRLPVAGSAQMAAPHGNTCPAVSRASSWLIRATPVSSVSPASAE